MWLGVEGEAKYDILPFSTLVYDLGESQLSTRMWKRRNLNDNKWTSSVAAKRVVTEGGTGPRSNAKEKEILRISECKP